MIEPVKRRKYRWRMVARGTFTLDRALDATGWVCGMATRRNLQVIGAAVSRKASPSALMVIVRTVFVLLAFGGAWFAFLRGLTALGEC